MSGSRVTLTEERFLLEYRALREGCGLVDRSSLPLLEILGEDRVRFLNGLVTCDLSNLETGDLVQGLLTAQKGKVLADVVIMVQGDRLRLQLPAAVVRDSIRAHLEKYVVADRVEIRAVDDLHSIALVGPEVTEEGFASGALVAVSRAGARHGSLELFDQAVGYFRCDLFRLPSLTLWIGTKTADRFLDRLCTEEKRLIQVGVEAQETVRVEAGIPLWGVDFDQGTLPQESGLEALVDYDKGCYLGQEVIARLHYRGQAPRLMRGLVFESASLPPLRTPILFEDRQAGLLTSATYSPHEKRVVGLGLLQRRAAEPGSRVLLSSGESAEVRLL